MATVGIYADESYLDMIDEKAHELRISKSQLTRLAFDHLMGLTPPKKFGLDCLSVDKIESSETKNAPESCHES